MAGLVENFFYGLCKGTSTDIVQRCFVEPALSPGVQGYNPVNTLVYGGILLLLSFFVIFPLLDRRGIKFDFKFILALLPYILFGSAFRVIHDMGIFSRSFNLSNRRPITSSPVTAAICRNCVGARKRWASIWRFMARCSMTSRPCWARPIAPVPRACLPKPWPSRCTSASMPRACGAWARFLPR